MNVYLSGDFATMEPAAQAIRNLKSRGFDLGDLMVFSDEPILFPPGVLRLAEPDVVDGRPGRDYHAATRYRIHLLRAAQLRSGYRRHAHLFLLGHGHHLV